MARNAQPTQRSQLIQMAETWEQLAEARRRQLEKEGKTEESDGPAGDGPEGDAPKGDGPEGDGPKGGAPR